MHILNIDDSASDALSFKGKSDHCEMRRVTKQLQMTRTRLIGKRLANLVDSLQQLGNRLPQWKAQAQSYIVVTTQCLETSCNWQEVVFHRYYLTSIHAQFYFLVLVDALGEAA